MKTKEFIKKVEELGFGIRITGNIFYILKDGGKTIARVEVDKAFSIDICCPSSRSLEEEIRGKLFYLVVEYASTPVKDREEEKKFYLEHKWLESVGNRYLIWDPNDTYYYLDDSAEYYSGKMKFTLNEIEEIKENFDTDLADFELVEVADD